LTIRRGEESALKFGDYVKVKSLQSVANFAAHLREAGLGLPVG